MLPPRSDHWETLRAAWLALHGQCAACGGTACLEVHHIKPYHLFPELELSALNLITLCEAPAHKCHLMIGHVGHWSLWDPQVIYHASLKLAALTSHHVPLIY